MRVQLVQDCSEHPRITVLRNGKPVPGIAVEVYRPVEHPTSSHYRYKVGKTLRTDNKGEVVLQKLPPGIVEVTAHWSSGSLTAPDLEANLSVRYFPEDPQPEDRFTIDLEPDPSDRQYVEQTARAAEQKPIPEKVEQFGGIVVDPAGAPIRNVSIEVAQLHVPGARRVRKVQTNAEGHFRALVPPGDYVAIFSVPGFQQTVDAFTIDQASKLTEMRVLLRVGAVTE